MLTYVETEILFGAAGNAADFQRRGWYGPETTWTWTEGLRSELEFPAPNAPFGYYVEIEVSCLTLWPERPAQPVLVYADDTPVAVLSLCKAGIFALFCPAPAGLRVVLAFDLPGAISIAQIRGGTGDPRQLALAFTRVRIMPLLEAIVPPDGEPSLVASDDRTVGDAVAATEYATGGTLRELLMRFELVSGNCRFGLVQRAFGCEPLSLLRFAGATPRVTIRCLETKFQLLGDSLSVAAAPDGSDEWMVEDAIGLSYHSGKPLSVLPDAVISAERKKIAFLREKLLSDLTEGEKIFLYAEHLDQPSEAAIAVFLALRRLTSAPMLWLRETPYSETSGMVKEIAPGLFMGFIDFHAKPLIGEALAVTIEIFRLN